MVILSVAVASAVCFGGNELQGERKMEKWGDAGRDVWASPGATGTHTTPLAFPRDRQTDRPTYLR